MDHLIKTKKEFKKFKETRHLKYIYQNELDEAYFQHDIAYGDFKDLPRRTAAVKVLRDKAVNIARSPKYDVYQKGLTSMVYTFFDKKTSNTNKGTGIDFENDLANIKLISKFKKQNSLFIMCYSK